jgi:hypothetical protein
LALQRQCDCGNHVMGGECDSCHKEKASSRLQRAGNHAESINEVPPIVHEVLRSSGQPLDASTRAFFEPRFAYDFSQVRVHTDTRAAESARAVSALAYTVGREVVFAAGRYTPHTLGGRTLLAHELTHVMQQGLAGPEAPSASIKIGSASDPSESAAEHATNYVMSGSTPDLVPSARALRRAPDIDDPNRNLGPPVSPLPLPPVCSFKWKNGKPYFNCERLPLPSPLPKDSPDIPLNPKDWPKPGDLFPKGEKGQVDCGLFPGRHPGGSKDFKGQCCRGTESKENCCPPTRIASKDSRCCSDDELILGGECVKSSTLPSLNICLPQQKTLAGKCCTLPTVPEGLKCVLPSAKAPQPKTPASTPQPAAPPLSPVEVFFNLDKPQPGQPGSNLTILTSEGRGNLPAIREALRDDLTLKVQLIGMCSVEGDAEYNYALGKRRAEWLASQLGIDSSRLADSAEKDLRSECRAIRSGLVTCGAAGADSPGNPHDRRVLARFFRPSPK